MNFCFVILGAGKTHTMLGSDSDPGIMAQALNDLFDEMQRTQEAMKYKVTMSYLEVSIKSQCHTWRSVQSYC